jgi:DNA repair ATPase RecN
MQPLEVAATCKGTAARIDEGRETGLVNGVQGLLGEASDTIEHLVDQVRREVARANKYDEALQMSKGEISELRERVSVLSEVNERYEKMIDHFLDE